MNIVKILNNFHFEIRNKIINVNNEIIKKDVLSPLKKIMTSDRIKITINKKIKNLDL